MTRVLGMIVTGFGLLLASCSGPDASVAGRSGSGTETTTGIIAAVVYPDGSPARNARVRLRPEDYVQQSGLGKTAATIIDTFTDSTGSFRIRGMDPGAYAVEIDDQHSAAVLIRHTVGEEEGLQDLGRYTVKPYARISGVVNTAGLTGRKLFVQVRGLERLASVGETGFSFDNLPEGAYELHCVAADEPDSLIGGANVTSLAGETATVVVRSDWTFSKTLRLNTTASGADVLADVVDFPLLVRLDEANFDFSQAADSGQDIRFEKSDGTALAYEIEQYDPLTRTASIWVRLDTVYGNCDTQTIRMSWGNSLARSQSSGAAVFDTAAGFQGVWHLGQKADAIAYDATHNHYDGTPNGLSAAPAVSGPIGGAQAFDGTTGHIEMLGTADGKLNLPQFGQYSISAWVYTNTIDSGSYLIAGKGTYQYFLDLRYANSAMRWAAAEYVYGSRFQWQGSNEKVPAQTGQWKYVVGVRNGTDLSLYVDGVAVALKNAIRVADSSIHRDSSANFTIGGFAQPVETFWDEGYCTFNGMIDEVRICDINRSEDWIKLCYMNQKPDNALVR